MKNVIDFPFILETKQQAEEKAISNFEGRENGLTKRKFNLSAGHQKDIFIAEIGDARSTLEIYHQLGLIPLLKENYTFCIQIIGAGPPVKAGIRLERVNDDWVTKLVEFKCDG